MGLRVLEGLVGLRVLLMGLRVLLVGLRVLLVRLRVLLVLRGLLVRVRLRGLRLGHLRRRLRYLLVLLRGLRLGPVLRGLLFSLVLRGLVLLGLVLPELVLLRLVLLPSLGLRLSLGLLPTLGLLVLPLIHLLRYGRLLGHRAPRLVPALSLRRHRVAGHRPGALAGQLRCGPPQLRGLRRGQNDALVCRASSGMLRLITLFALRQRGAPAIGIWGGLATTARDGITGSRYRVNPPRCHAPAIPAHPAHTRHAPL
ncbi:hypothetical protein ACIQM4_14280 [Streptomyces sp. NPDC091272]|uniref:hypothetical protein n=1 Tax=Streptomyces sp. NPDC091272 TaxID=3365981 RepID=UPI0037FF47BE